MLYTLVDKYDAVYNNIARLVVDLEQQMTELKGLTDEFYDLNNYFISNSCNEQAKILAQILPLSAYILSS